MQQPPQSCMQTIANTGQATTGPPQQHQHYGNQPTMQAMSAEPQQTDLNPPTNHNQIQKQPDPQNPQSFTSIEATSSQRYPSENAQASAQEGGQQQYIQQLQEPQHQSASLPFTAYSAQTAYPQQAQFITGASNPSTTTSSTQMPQQQHTLEQQHLQHQAYQQQEQFQISTNAAASASYLQNQEIEYTGGPDMPNTSAPHLPQDGSNDASSTDPLSKTKIIQVGLILQLISTKGDLIPYSNSLITPFHSHEAPNINILLYYVVCSYNAGLHDSQAPCILVLLERLCQTAAQKGHPIFINSFTIHRLILTTVLVVSKMYNDIYYTNQYIASVGGVTLHNINELERFYMSIIDWNVYISRDEFDFYERGLLAFQQSEAASATASPTLVGMTGPVMQNFGQPGAATSSIPQQQQMAAEQLLAAQVQHQQQLQAQQQQQHQQQHQYYSAAMAAVGSTHQTVQQQQMSAGAAIGRGGAAVASGVPSSEESGGRSAATQQQHQMARGDNQQMYLHQQTMGSFTNDSISHSQQHGLVQDPMMSYQQHQHSMQQEQQMRNMLGAASRGVPPHQYQLQHSAGFMGNDGNNEMEPQGLKNAQFSFGSQQQVYQPPPVQPGHMTMEQHQHRNPSMMDQQQNHPLADGAGIHRAAHQQPHELQQQHQASQHQPQHLVAPHYSHNSEVRPHHGNHPAPNQASAAQSTHLQERLAMQEQSPMQQQSHSHYAVPQASVLTAQGGHPQPATANQAQQAAATTTSQPSSSQQQFLHQEPQSPSAAEMSEAINLSMQAQQDLSPPRFDFRQIQMQIEAQQLQQQRRGPQGPQ